MAPSPAPNGTSGRTLLFSDTAGLALIHEAAPWFRPAGIVAASIRRDQQDDLRRIATDYGVPLFVQPRPAEEDYPRFLAEIAALAPSQTLVNSYSMILRPDLLATLNGPVLNIHAAPLPEFRGANPVEWALIEEATFSGASLHYVDQGVDTGDIVDVRRIPIFFEDTWKDVRARNASACVDILRDYLPKIDAGEPLARTKQNPDIARHFRRRTAADGTLPWATPLRKIHNMVRALVTPHPGALLTADADNEQISRYHTIAELAFLKHRALGGLLWQENGVLLQPRPPTPLDEKSREPRIAGNSRLEFLITAENDQKGECTIFANWTEPLAPCEVEVSAPPACLERAFIVAARFCESELLRPSVRRL